MSNILKYNLKGIEEKTLINLYLKMLKPRLIEEKMLLLLRQGKISKWFSGIGQEAISVGASMAMAKDGILRPTISSQILLLLSLLPLRLLTAHYSLLTTCYSLFAT